MPTPTTADLFIRENVAKILEEREWSVRELGRRLEDAESETEGGFPSHGRLSDLLNGRRGAITWSEVQQLAAVFETTVFEIVLPERRHLFERNEKSTAWFRMTPDATEFARLDREYRSGVVYISAIREHPAMAFWYSEMARLKNNALSLGYNDSAWSDLLVKMAWEHPEMEAAVLQKQGMSEGVVADLFDDIVLVTKHGAGAAFVGPLRNRWAETDLSWLPEPVTTWMEETDWYGEEHDVD